MITRISVLEVLRLQSFFVQTAPLPQKIISLVYLANNILTNTSFCSLRDTVFAQTNTLSFTDTVKLFPLLKLQFGTDVSSQSKFEQCSQGRLKSKMQDFQILNIYHGFTHTSKVNTSAALLHRRTQQRS